ncbi:uncharacterized protein [Montipora foliosa]|uniref:uncharacterized protein n=1 Tax=Montipora foliosa TaxID=591990 RepID=UPI0035F14D7F
MFETSKQLRRWDRLRLMVLFACLGFSSISSSTPSSQSSSPVNSADESLSAVSRNIALKAIEAVVVSFQALALKPPFPSRQGAVRLKEAGKELLKYLYLFQVNYKTTSTAGLQETKKKLPKYLYLFPVNYKTTSTADDNTKQDIMNPEVPKPELPSKLLTPWWDVCIYYTTAAMMVLSLTAIGLQTTKDHLRKYWNQSLVAEEDLFTIKLDKSAEKE